MEAQVIKYVLRWRKKNGIEDLQKAEHFLHKLMEHHEATRDLHEGNIYTEVEQARRIRDFGDMPKCSLCQMYLNDKGACPQHGEVRPEKSAG